MSNVLEDPIESWLNTPIWWLSGHRHKQKHFATDLRFLNDREFVHARKTTEQVISLNISLHPIHIRWQMNVDFDAAALSEAFNVPLGRGTKPCFVQGTGDGCSASTMLCPREF